MQLGTDDVLKLSPDASSAKAAIGLAQPSRWLQPAFNDQAQAVWGECPGSGATPYRVQVDRQGPAFRCSCPSRKFPCKHGLALLLLLAQQPAAFTSADPPAWVVAWLDSRRQRDESRKNKHDDNAATSVAGTGRDGEAPTGEPSPAAGRRSALRQQRLSDGLDELELWLNDRVKHGLATLSGQPAIWEEMARRMVDAQLPGLAFRLRRLGRLVDGSEAWPAQELGGMGQLRLLIDAGRRMADLPQTVQADLRHALGMNSSRETVLADGERLSDDWLVIGQSCHQEDRLTERRVWLLGLHSARWAMLLDFAYGNRYFEQIFVTGSQRRGTLAYYPGNAPLRAIVVDTDLQAIDPPVPWTRAAPTLVEALDALSDALAANPWQSPQPLLIGDAVPVFDERGWTLRTADRLVLPLTLAAEDGWPLLAESGGAALAVFGEWADHALRPLSAWQFFPSLDRLWLAE